MLGRFALALAAVALLVPSAAAAPMVSDGASLQKRCAAFQLATPSAALVCRAYIGALSDILSDGHEVYGLRACPSPDQDREAVVKAVRAWMDQHPESLNDRASRVTIQALAEAYPCAS